MAPAKRLAGAGWRRYAWRTAVPCQCVPVSVKLKERCVEFFAQYAGFLLRTVTVVVAIVMVLLVIAALRSKGRGDRESVV